jgi:hypothetical protein
MMKRKTKAAIRKKVVTTRRKGEKVKVAMQKKRKRKMSLKM